MISKVINKLIEMQEPQQRMARCLKRSSQHKPSMFWTLCGRLVNVSWHVGRYITCNCLEHASNVPIVMRSECIIQYTHVTSSTANCLLVQQRTLSEELWLSSDRFRCKNIIYIYIHTHSFTDLLFSLRMCRSGYD